jgi:hypothetical protein
MQAPDRLRCSLTFTVLSILMRHLHLSHLLLFTALLSACRAATPVPVAAASPSRCGAVFDTTRHENPRAEERDRLVSREVVFVVQRPAESYVADFIAGAAQLQNYLRGTDRLPGVDHVEPLSGGDFPAVGSRRLVCLRGGGSAIEEVLLQEPRLLRYLVHDYTVAAARPIAYAVGEFRFDSLSTTSTRVTWRYSFKLRGNTFPGTLGPLGRSLFRRSFVDRDYARFMDAAVLEMQAWPSRP